MNENTFQKHITLTWSTEQKDAQVAQFENENVISTNDARVTWEKSNTPYYYIQNFICD